MIMLILKGSAYASILKRSTFLSKLLEILIRYMPLLLVIHSNKDRHALNVKQICLNCAHAIKPLCAMNTYEKGT